MARRRAQRSPNRSPRAPNRCASDTTGAARRLSISCPCTSLTTRSWPAADLGAGAQILLGLGERELQPVAVDFAEQPNLIVLGETGCGKTTALRTLCREIMRTNDADSAQLVMVDFRRTLLGAVTSGHLAGYAVSAAAPTSQLPALGSAAGSDAGR